MNLPVLSDISFDEQDANLFLVDDARLRADALKHSVLPRLRVVMDAAITLIREIYGIEVLDDSILSVYPNFRQKRENELKHMYDSAFVGLGGQRKDKWPGFSRRDGKPVRFLPFRFAFVFVEDALFVLLENGWLKGLDDRSFEAILRFHIEYEHKINPLCFVSEMRPAMLWSDDLPLLSAFRDQYEFRIRERAIENCFFGKEFPIPVTSTNLYELVRYFACFFPVYDAYIQMAKGLPYRMDSLISRLSDWLQRADEYDIDEEQEEQMATAEIRDQATRAAESKVRVMPAIRWQVFQRDNWKCVACGRGSREDVILHVDHIVPRSRGGADTLGNYQTLCGTCNIGKGNRDDTDLRNSN